MVPTQAFLTPAFLVSFAKSSLRSRRQRLSFHLWPPSGAEQYIALGGRRSAADDLAAAGNGAMEVLTAAGRSACLFPSGVGRVAVIKASYPALSVICLGLAGVLGRWPLGMAAVVRPQPEISDQSRAYGRRRAAGRGRGGGAGEAVACQGCRAGCRAERGEQIKHIEIKHASYVPVMDFR